MGKPKYVQLSLLTAPSLFFCPRFSFPFEDDYEEGGIFQCLPFRSPGGEKGEEEDRVVFCTLTLFPPLIVQLPTLQFFLSLHPGVPTAVVVPDFTVYT